MIDERVRGLGQAALARRKLGIERPLARVGARERRPTEPLLPSTNELVLDGTDQRFLLAGDHGARSVPARHCRKTIFALNSSSDEGPEAISSRIADARSGANSIA